MFRLVIITLLLIYRAQSHVSSHRITYLPGYGDVTHEQHTGYLPTHDGYNSSLFYWFITSLNTSRTSESTPIILWLNGGPGCSSMTGSLIENGPYRVNFGPDREQKRLLDNPHCWCTRYHQLYIDQPIGTGFSSNHNRSELLLKNDAAMTPQLYTALKHWFTISHPTYRHNTLYIAGESYAGKYIPHLATHILAHQHTFHINLGGIAIGDGFMHPLIQRFEYGNQAFAAGLMDRYQQEQFGAMGIRCKRALLANEMLEAAEECNNMQEYLLLVSGGVNKYDERIYGRPYNGTIVLAYLNDPEFRSAMNIIDTTTLSTTCSPQVYDTLRADVYRSSSYLLPHLFANTRVMLYNGNFDIKDAPPGTEKILISLINWPDRRRMFAAPRLVWRSSSPDRRVFGYVRHVANVTVVVVAGAGHFVPMDQPEAALDMITRFIEQQSFCRFNETLGPSTCVASTDVEPRSDHLCALLDCQHGVCEEFAGGARCVCGSGWIGMDCLAPSVSIQLDLGLPDYIYDKHSEYPEPPAPVIRRTTSPIYDPLSDDQWDDTWQMGDTDRIETHDGKRHDHDDEMIRSREDEDDDEDDDRNSNSRYESDSSISHDDRTSSSDSHESTSESHDVHGDSGHTEYHRRHRRTPERSRDIPSSSQYKEHQSTSTQHPSTSAFPHSYSAPIIRTSTFISTALPYNLTVLKPLQSIVFYFMNEHAQHILTISLHEKNGTGGAISVSLAYDRSRDYVQAKQDFQLITALDRLIASDHSHTHEHYITAHIQNPGHFFIVVSNEGVQEVHYNLNITLATRAHMIQSFVQRMDVDVDVDVATWIPSWRQWCVMIIMNIIVITIVALVYHGKKWSSIHIHHYQHISTTDVDVEASSWPPAASANPITSYGSTTS